MLGLSDQRLEPLAAGLGAHASTGSEIVIKMLSGKICGRRGLSFKTNGTASQGPHPWLFVA